jgi:hypothetical protein
MHLCTNETFIYKAKPVMLIATVKGAIAFKSAELGKSLGDVPGQPQCKPCNTLPIAPK